MTKSQLLYVASLLVCLGGAVIATAILLAMSSSQTQAPSAGAKVDAADTSQSIDDAEGLAPYTIEGQEIERGHFPYIIRRISVAKSITEQELRVLLLHELEQIRQLDYGPMPEHRCAFTLLAYCEPANARNFSGPKLATISLLRGKNQPNLYIAEETLAAIKEPPQLKFGFEDDIRKKLYWELVRANYECSDQSDREFSEPVPPYSEEDLSQYISKRGDRFAELWEQRQDEIGREYKLNREQTDEIHLEGMRKHWPQPVDPLRESSDKKG